MRLLVAVRRWILGDERDLPEGLNRGTRRAFAFSYRRPSKPRVSHGPAYSSFDWARLVARGELWRQGKHLDVVG